jgi:CO/xanthine dehydrogenase FAD-binding subunit
MIAAYHQPEALDVALDQIANGATPIAGATGLYTGRGKRDLKLVDVTRLGLDKIQVTNDAVIIGATVTLGQLAHATDIPAMAGAMLRKAARGIASTPLRNAITLGGNVAHVVYWADMPVALLALDAIVEVQRAGNASSQRPIADCLRDGKKAWEGGLITSFRIPLATGTLGFGYERFTRTASDYAFASTCVTMRVDGGKAADVRVALGAVQSRPSRVAELEALIEGNVVSTELLHAVEDKVKDVVKVAPNFRAPADYRRELAAVLTGRAVEKAWTWASREDG